MVELFHCLDQAQVALLNQIQKLHAAAHIALGDGDDQTEVGLGQALLGTLALFAALLDVESQLDFLVRGQQRHTADLLEVDLDRVVDGNALRRKGILKIIHALLGQVGGIRSRFVRLVVDDLDAVAFQRLVQFLQLVDVKRALFQRVVDLVSGQLAGAAAVFDQFADDVFLFCHK